MSKTLKRKIYRAENCKTANEVRIKNLVIYEYNKLWRSLYVPCPFVEEYLYIYYVTNQ